MDDDIVEDELVDFHTQLGGQVEEVGFLGFCGDDLAWRRGEEGPVDSGRLRLHLHLRESGAGDG